MNNKTEKNKATGIKSWPKEDRPREKLLRNGEHTLSNSELLAILLRTGVKGESAIDLARKIMNKFGTFRDLSHSDMRQWDAFKGLGAAKIAQIKAAIEIGRRFREDEQKASRQKIRSADEVVQILLPRMRDLKKEVFKVVLLDSKNQIIEIHEATEGSVNRAYPIIRDIFQKALQSFAISIICAHNHPSGDPKPSKEDRDFTKELYQAGQVMDIRVLDHIIIGNDRHYSFADEGDRSA